MIKTWEELKQGGSAHYKLDGGVEVIDLLRCLMPHASLTVLQIKALSDCIKYAARMLTKGANDSDCLKIIHYTEMVRNVLEDTK